MKSISGREFAKIIEKHGWILLRVSGSHHIYGKPGSIVRLSLPIHGNMPLKLGLLKHLIKMTGLEEKDLK
jgi:predicted RNA binding protein YcfA (HicA-like mRNA interferase family)